MSQFGANFEIKFLIVYRHCWLTLMLQKESRIPGNRKFRKSCFSAANTCMMTLGLRSPDHSLVVTLPIFVIENKTYQELATPVLKLSSLAIKHHVIKEPTLLVMAEQKLRVSDLA